MSFPFFAPVAVTFHRNPQRPQGAKEGAWAMLYVLHDGAPRSRRLVQGYEEALAEAKVWMRNFLDVERIALDCFETRERLVLRRTSRGVVVFEPSWCAARVGTAKELEWDADSTR